MKKIFISILVGTSFFVTMPAVSADTYTEGDRAYFNSSTCPSWLSNYAHYTTVKGGSMKYGCWNNKKPYTEYHKDTSADYQAYTQSTYYGQSNGTVRDYDRTSNHAELSVNGSGNVYFKVKNFS